MPQLLGVARTCSSSWLDAAGGRAVELEEVADAVLAGLCRYPGTHRCQRCHRLVLFWSNLLFPVRQVAESAGLMKRAVLTLLLVVLTAVPARGVLRLPDVEPFSVAEEDGAWDKVLATHHHLNQPHHHFYSF